MINFFGILRGRARVVRVHYFLVICASRTGSVNFAKRGRGIFGCLPRSVVVPGWTVTSTVKKLELTLCCRDKLHIIKGINNNVLLQGNPLLLHIS